MIRSYTSTSQPQSRNLNLLIGFVNGEQRTGEEGFGYPLPTQEPSETQPEVPRGPIVTETRDRRAHCRQ